MYARLLTVERRVDIGATHQHEAIETLHHCSRIFGCQRLRRNYDGFAPGSQNCVKISPTCE
jgi:hypothetical protein